ncbi:MAG: hypothetical protein HOV82_17130 [Streptomyces sp.]|nr:hypothetical protein [Streptomyces sp.]NUP36185.1 hypothetical protein [Streptomyces sp.]NUS75532.1 hypothetical protein [Streptomyces sp.]
MSDDRALAEILARELGNADASRDALRDRLDRANQALIQVLYVAEVIEANGIKWAADSVRNAVRTAVE